VIKDLVEKTFHISVCVTHVMKHLVERTFHIPVCVTHLIKHHPVSSTNKTDHHDIAEILLKVALNTNKQTEMEDSRSDSMLKVEVVCLALIEFRAHNISGDKH
jgi:hypothetical protein